MRQRVVIRQRRNNRANGVVPKVVVACRCQLTYGTSHLKFKEVSVLLFFKYATSARPPPLWSAFLARLKEMMFKLTRSPSTRATTPVGEGGEGQDVVGRERTGLLDVVVAEVQRRDGRVVAQRMAEGSALLGAEAAMRGVESFGWELIQDRKHRGGATVSARDRVLEATSTVVGEGFV
jgi:hypothetical protein